MVIICNFNQLTKKIPIKLNKIAPNEYQLSKKPNRAKNDKENQNT